MIRKYFDMLKNGKFTWKSIFFGLILCVVVFKLGWYSGIFWYQSSKDAAHHYPLRLESVNNNFEYRFINPLLACDSALNRTDDRELKSFEKEVEQLADNMVKRKQVAFLSVRYQDLNKGLTFGINGSEKFSPASLLKVPIVMAYFKLAEYHAGVLKTEIKYEDVKDLNGVQFYKPQEKLVYGHAYAVNDLIRRSIVYSDNNADQLLESNLPIQAIKREFGDLGLQVPCMNDYESCVLSVNEYTVFFRILFNASYLTRDYSEKVLTLLTKSDFTQGLVAGVPRDVVVAHKFGEAVKNGERQLHDCGIVYYPNHPYLLCVMTRGKTVENLADAIKDISHLVYEEIDKQHDIRQ